MKPGASFTRQVPRLFILTTLLLSLIISTASGTAQIGAGATLTVLQGSVQIVRPDGTVLNPATSGQALDVGDQITAEQLSGALVTFFDGSEIEMGSESRIVLSSLNAPVGSREITIASLFGPTVHRVVAFSDPGALYRVESGSTLTLVRGTVFGHFADAVGAVVVALESCGNLDAPDVTATAACLDFPADGQPVQINQKVTLLASGERIVEPFMPGTSLFEVVAPGSTTPSEGAPSAPPTSGEMPEASNDNGNDNDASDNQSNGTRTTKPRVTKTPTVPSKPSWTPTPTRAPTRTPTRTPVPGPILR